ncbi:MAG: alpha/beta hydrolase [Clostridia bacterium]|nr:alpha/beta hydrolase [Clostridia bacterium]
MQKNIFTVESEFDKLPLEVAVYEPSGTPKGVLQILHGMCEYKERYDDFMRFFCERGYIVVCHDQRGHGESVKDKKDYGYFYERTARAIVLDAVQITREIKTRYQGLPVTLFGHSMGSMVARCYLCEHDLLIDKAIVCGSPSKNPLAGVGVLLADCIALFRGAHYRSKLLTQLSTGKGDKNFPGEGKGAWLSANRADIDAFYGNEKGNYRFTCNGFVNLFKLMVRTYRKRDYRVQNPDLPILFVSGTADAVMGTEKQWRNAVEFLRKAGYTAVTGKLYEGQRHEIFRDTKKDEVFADLLAFLEN